MSEHLVRSGVTFSKLEACKIVRVIFHNPEATPQSLAFSNASLPSTQAVFSLFAAAASPAHYDLGAFPFLSGFTCTPSHANISNIIIEYEDIKP